MARIWRLVHSLSLGTTAVTYDEPRLKKGEVVEVVERSVLGRVEEERDALIEALERIAAKRLTPDEAKALYDAAWREPDVRWNPEFNLAAYKSGLQKLRALSASHAQPEDPDPEWEEDHPEPWAVDED